ncbi:endonuclease [Winogradskyella maritima]|uniref:Endonuclease n=1 Tax=Winogradskyella maritima TaxID=1517766 RepID=A0ABV8AFD6_9FLAO|nr:endonuclease [Winogradskyella maritima]
MEHTIAFYNIENLFDIENDPLTNDDDFLPNSQKRWTEKRYQNKLRKLGLVIAQIGESIEDGHPAIVGLAEVENYKVVEDLVNSQHLKEYNYGIVHYDSSDERGIDVALIYDQTKFTVTHSETFNVFLVNPEGLRDYTRDILLVSGELEGKPLHVIVNHWSSRREGTEATEYKRLGAADVVNSIIRNLKDEDPKATVVVMGDFNDNPDSNSLKSLELQSQLYNPFKTIWTKDKGSNTHYFEWNLFDQVLISNSVFSPESDIDFEKAAIFDSKFLTQYQGKYKGEPFRTYAGKRYKGGYSDHFPVYLKLDITS